jgi:hypothetical protein
MVQRTHQIIRVGILLVAALLTSCMPMPRSSRGVSNLDPTPREGARPGSRVTLQVRTAAGRPLAGAMVEIAVPGAENPAVGMVADAAGEFHWTLPPQTYQITAHAPDYVSQTTQIDVTNVDPITVTVTLRPRM